MGSNPNNLPDMRMRGGANMDMATQSAVDFNSTSNDVLAVQGLSLIHIYGRKIYTVLNWTHGMVSPL